MEVGVSDSGGLEHRISESLELSAMTLHALRSG